MANQRNGRVRTQQRLICIFPSVLHEMHGERDDLIKLCLPVSVHSVQGAPRHLGVQREKDKHANGNRPYRG